MNEASILKKFLEWGRMNKEQNRVCLCRGREGWNGIDYVPIEEKEDVEIIIDFIGYLLKREEGIEDENESEWDTRCRWDE